MPYIKPEQRKLLDPHIDGVVNCIITIPGSVEGRLNYAITKLVLGVLRDAGINYAGIAGVTGVLENVKQEFYRRVSAGFEDEKCEMNGDVYEGI